MKKVNVWLFGVVILFLSLQSALAQKEKFQSIFIYNFSKYVKWPDNQSSGKFVIGIYGSSAMLKDLTAMASSKTVNGMSIEVKQFKSTDGISDCHILYVASSESRKLSAILSSTQAHPVLVVTDSPGLAKKGAAINFIEVEGKIKFELNQETVESHGLKVSGSLISLAILV